MGFDDHGATGEIVDLLGSLRLKGVRLWAEHGALRYECPKGALTKHEIDRLRAFKEKLVSLLEAVADLEIIEPSIAPEYHNTHTTPLTFSQLAHWNLYQLSTRPSFCLVCAATRLHGKLRMAWLEKSLAEVIHQHSALRTRIVVRDGIPYQDVADSIDCRLHVDDLTGMSAHDRNVEVKRLIEQNLLDPIEVKLHPLLRIRLLRLQDDEHVLITTMEHIISDGVSMSVFLQDVFSAYKQAATGPSFGWPARRVQFADYAVWQRRMHRSWIEKHGTYWERHLSGSQRVRFPSDKEAIMKHSAGWGSASFKISKNLKIELEEWSRVRQTTLVMSVFAAYVCLVLRWCKVSDAVFVYETDGRTNKQLDGAVGYYASPLYLRIEIINDDRLVDMLNRVTSEYCKAYTHADFSFMEAQLPRPEFTRNSLFNWVRQEFKEDLFDFRGAIACSPVYFERPVLASLQRDTEPIVAFFENNDDIPGLIQFPLDRFSISSMERFGRNLVMFVETLTTNPDQRVMDVLLVQ